MTLYNNQRNAKVLIYLSIYFCLTCFGLSVSPSSETGVQIRQWFTSPGYGVSATPLLDYKLFVCITSFWFDLSLIFLHGQEEVTFETPLRLDVLYLQWRWTEHSDTAGLQSAIFYQTTQ
jgi:hypothetical protein